MVYKLIFVIDNETSLSQIVQCSLVLTKEMMVGPNNEQYVIQVGEPKDTNILGNFLGWMVKLNDRTQN